MKNSLLIFNLEYTEGDLLVFIGQIGWNTEAQY